MVEPDSALPPGVEQQLLARLEAGALELPMLPHVAGEVLARTSRDDCDARSLAELIKRDQSLSGHVLRVANSALYLPTAKITSLQQVVSRLGMETIRQIALVISCQTRVFRVVGHEGEVRGMFRHSLAAALFAQELARLRRWNVEEAFLGGLLHDVGRPVLLQALVDLGRELGVAIGPAALAGALDQHHALVGSVLVAGWKLPARLGETILFHHAPERAPSAAQTATMTGLADDLAHFALGSRPIEQSAIEQHRLLAPLNVYPDELAALLARKDAIVATVEEMA